ncbi:septal ring lytic transglycosylase RlpA family protein [Jiella marina]|uniref:septal ring lytic transglycosylase RlpA family protein n=1 Tax=Jiella sp. LLJ827 TaxID=2917712 RepID=UPI00350E3DCD
MKFDSRSYGVPASPRVTKSKRVPKGGGRSHVGKPYKVKGKWYYPKDQPGYVKTGQASWYGPNFHGRLTANGEVYDMYGLSAAHKTFPLPSYATVTNLKNGNRLMVRINDRGPFAHGREIDLSAQAAELLGFKSAGTADVKVEYVGRAPLEGDDTKMLMASFEPGDGSASMTPDQVMVASVETDRGAGVGGMAMAYGEELPGVRANGAEDDGGSGRSGAKGWFGASLFVNSYAAATQAESGAASALQTMSVGSTGETIAVGLVDDHLLERVRSVTRGQGHLVVEPAPDLGGQTVKFMVDNDNDADMLLSRLWQVGAEDAFVLRD